MPNRVPRPVSAPGAFVPLFLQDLRSTWAGKGIITRKSPSESGGSDYYSLYPARSPQASSAGLSPQIWTKLFFMIGLEAARGNRQKCHNEKAIII